MKWPIKAMHDIKKFSIADQSEMLKEIREKCLRYNSHPEFSVILDRLEQLFAELSTLDRTSSPPNSYNPKTLGNEPKKGYVICITPRSGSTLLSSALSEQTLRGHVGLGYPGEIFNLGFIKPRAMHYGCRSIDEYTKWALWESTDKSGVFAVKGDLFQLLPFLLTPTFQHFLPNTKFIYLTREDVLLQAISFVIAQHTGKWTSESIVSGRYEENFEEICTNVELIVQMMSSFEKLFSFSNIAPCQIFTSDVENDLASTIKKVINFVDAPIAEHTIQLRVQTSRTRDEVNEVLKKAVVSKLSLYVPNNHM
jgi:LPS sulfotransferase NodH